MAAKPIPGNREDFCLYGIRFTVTGDTKKAREMAWLARARMEQVKAANVNNLDIVGGRFRFPGGVSMEVQSVHGFDLAWIHVPPTGGGAKRKKRYRLMPAFEAVNADRELIGLVICRGGTWAAPGYQFLPGTMFPRTLDPFEWGQWKVNYTAKPFDEAVLTDMVLTTYGGTTLIEISCKAEDFAFEHDWTDPDGYDNTAYSSAPIKLCHEDCPDGGGEGVYFRWVNIDRGWESVIPAAISRDVYPYDDWDSPKDIVDIGAYYSKSATTGYRSISHGFYYVPWVTEPYDPLITPKTCDEGLTVLIEVDHDGDLSWPEDVLIGITPNSYQGFSTGDGLGSHMETDGASRTTYNFGYESTSVKMTADGPTGLFVGGAVVQMSHSEKTLPSWWDAMVSSGQCTYGNVFATTSSSSNSSGEEIVVFNGQKFVIGEWPDHYYYHRGIATARYYPEFNLGMFSMYRYGSSEPLQYEYYMVRDTGVTEKVAFARYAAGLHEITGVKDLNGNQVYGNGKFRLVLEIVEEAA